MVNVLLDLGMLGYMKKVWGRLLNSCNLLLMFVVVNW